MRHNLHPGCPLLCCAALHCVLATPGNCHQFLSQNHRLAPSCIYRACLFWWGNLAPTRLQCHRVHFGAPCLFPGCLDAQLYCTALYCTVLHCAVLHCTVLHCTVCLPWLHLGFLQVARLGLLRLSCRLFGLQGQLRVRAIW